MNQPKREHQRTMALWVNSMVDFKADHDSFILGRDALINALVPIFGIDASDRNFERLVNQRNWLRNQADGLRATAEG